MPYSATKARRLGCLALLALVVGLMVSSFAWMIGGPYTSAFPRPFDSVRWKAASADSGTRCGMLTDLTWRVGVEGKSRAELVRMLGEPDKDDDSGSSYWLLCPSFLDIYVLQVRWDKDRAVEAFTRDT